MPVGVDSDKTPRFIFFEALSENFPLMISCGKVFLASDFFIVRNEMIILS